VIVRLWKKPFATIQNGLGEIYSWMSMELLNSMANEKIIYKGKYQ